ncbi:unnamed protein product [Schistocephalus solidus]|uniref:Uncharacterized protein n=1 Tax=Schistocephalus solidus TaxID=70667 RepID=A0A183T4H1_SCHSO|nr:unnamed protein product [Schistocephalus solidus]
MQCNKTPTTSTSTPTNTYTVILASKLTEAISGQTSDAPLSSTTSNILPATTPWPVTAVTTTYITFATPTTAETTYNDPNLTCTTIRLVLTCQSTVS